MHVSFQNDDDFVLRVQCCETNEILESIPLTTLRGDLPPALIHDHVHWLNLATKIIEIRPFSEFWEQSSEHWRIDCSSEQHRLYKGQETLLDIRSPTWAMVSACFERLNNVNHKWWSWTSWDKPDLQSQSWQSMNLLITTSDSAPVPRLSVTLPRYGLSFFVNEREELESNDFKGMVYDENQTVGALYGLESMLVLRPKTHTAQDLVPESFIPRRLIIPNGQLRRHGDHQVQVDIDHFPFGFDEPLFRTYNVDIDLGLFVGDGSLKSIRYIAYLHAMTSCHRPDPLTGKTGAEAALHLSQSAGCRSIMKRKFFHGFDTDYPQIKAAHEEIHYWRSPKDRSHSYYSITEARREERAAKRATYLFPSNSVEPSSHKDCNHRLPIYPRRLDRLLHNRSAPELRGRTSTSFLDSQTRRTASDDISALDQLFSTLKTNTTFQQEYITHLDASAQSVRGESQIACAVTEGNNVKAFKRHFAQCRVNYMESVDIIKKSLGPTTDPHEQRLEQFGQWPSITVDVLLQYLATASPIEVPPDWKKCLTLFALLLLDLQRARRLLRFALDGLKEELLKELENEVCDGWNPEEYPDWLLIQVALLYRHASLYSHSFSFSSDTRKLFDSPQSGRSSDGDHVPTVRRKHCDASQYGRREIVRDHPHRCCGTRQWQTACPCRCSKSTDSSNVRITCFSPRRTCE